MTAAERRATMGREPLGAWHWESEIAEGRSPLFDINEIDHEPVAIDHQYACRRSSD
jgi:hypothetical protein